MTGRRIRRQAALPILNILVPQLLQVPLVAGRPFFITICCGSFISRLALHLTQYASMHLLLFELWLDYSVDRTLSNRTEHNLARSTSSDMTLASARIG